jgi:hypothetical protein
VRGIGTEGEGYEGMKGGAAERAERLRGERGIGHGVCCGEKEDARQAVRKQG